MGQLYFVTLISARGVCARVTEKPEKFETRRVGFTMLRFKQIRVSVFSIKILKIPVVIALQSDSLSFKALQNAPRVSKQLKSYA